MRNTLRFLPVCFASVLAAAEEADADVIVVDNGSTDGTREELDRLASARTQIIDAPGVSISALRNLGVMATSASVLAFVDADCELSRDHVARAYAALNSTEAAAVGAPYALPREPHWVEATWQQLHEVEKDGPAPHVPGGNLTVRRESFEAVGGFDVSLVTGEDAEFCQRLRRAGHAVYRVTSVKVIHHGNPKSVAAFFRKQRWHALGMFGTMRAGEADKPVITMFAHVVFLGVALVAVMWPGAPAGLRWATALLACNVIPVTAVLYRVTRGGAIRAPILQSVLLYHVYFAARLAALSSILRRRGAVRA